MPEATGPTVINKPLRLNNEDFPWMIWNWLKN